MKGGSESKDVNVDGSILQMRERLRRQEEVGSRLTLFREEAVQARGPSYLPGVIRVRAPYMGASASAGGLVLVFLVVVCLFGKITRQINAQGILIPAESALKVYSPSSGIVIRTFYSQGQHVKIHDPLFVISGERYGSDRTALLRHASDMILAHINSIGISRDLARRESFESMRSDREQISAIEQQSSLVTKEVEVLNKMIVLDEAILTRKINLRSAEIVPIGEQERAQRQLFEDQQHLSALLTNQQALNREDEKIKIDLEEQPIKLKLRLSDFDQQESVAQVELARNEVTREVIVEAPVDGVIGASVVFNGQEVTPDRPLVVISPEGSKLVAQMLVPSSGIGFLKVGNSVALKYDAFPYQTFGYYTGHIKNIGNVALLPSEIEALKITVGSKEPVFNVIAEIDRQDVTTYGSRTSLLPGSTFAASMSGETRFIWQWILNPLLSIKGQSFAGFGW